MEIKFLVSQARDTRVAHYFQIEGLIYQVIYFIASCSLMIKDDQDMIVHTDRGPMEWDMVRAENYLAQSYPQIKYDRENQLQED